MFGERLREKDEVYAYGAEWLEIVSRLWGDEGSFDDDGTFFQLEHAQAGPKPYGRSAR